MINIFKKQSRLLNGPELWQKVLDYLSPHFNDCVIAGGCIRDYYLGKSPKDIDVFCLWDATLESCQESHISENTFCITTKKSELSKLIPNMKRMEHGSEYELKADGKGIQHVYYFDYLGYKINIITMCKSPLKPILVTDTFDFNICKSAYIGNGVIIDNPLAKYDRDNNIVTISEIATYADDVQYKRFTRFNKKYNGRFKLRGVKKIIDVQVTLPSDAVLLKYDDILLDTSIGYKLGLVSFYRTVNKISPLREWVNGNKDAYVLIHKAETYNGFYAGKTYLKKSHMFVQVKHLHKHKVIKYYVMKV